MHNVKRFKFHILGIWLIVFGMIPCFGGDIQITRIIDGDTLVILQQFKEYRVRLYGIDAPEKRQAYYQKSKDYLKELTRGKSVTFYFHDSTSYGRLIAELFVENKSINLQMIEAGYAWHSALYAPDRMDMANAQAVARRERRGLWADRSPIPPWKFRKN